MGRIIPVRSIWRGLRPDSVPVKPAEMGVYEILKHTVDMAGSDNGHDTVFVNEEMSDKEGMACYICCLCGKTTYIKELGTNAYELYDFGLMTEACLYPDGPER